MLARPGGSQLGLQAENAREGTFEWEAECTAQCNSCKGRPGQVSIAIHAGVSYLLKMDITPEPSLLARFPVTPPRHVSGPQIDSVSAYMLWPFGSETLSPTSHLQTGRHPECLAGQQTHVQPWKTGLHSEHWYGSSGRSLDHVSDQMQTAPQSRLHNCGCTGLT